MAYEEQWIVLKDTLVTPDDLRSGKVEAGPFMGADTALNEVYTVDCKEKDDCTHCALRLNKETLTKVLEAGEFKVVASGWWSTFSSKKVKLFLPNGEEFFSQPTVFERLKPCR